MDWWDGLREEAQVYYRGGCKEGYGCFVAAIGPLQWWAILVNSIWCLGLNLSEEKGQETAAAAVVTVQGLLRRTMA